MGGDQLITRCFDQTLLHSGPSRILESSVIILSGPGPLLCIINSKVEMEGKKTQFGQLKTEREERSQKTDNILRITIKL